MRILIINQHTQNHGDESAGFALIRSLYDAGFEDLIVSYNISDTSHTISERCYYNYKNVKHLVPTKQSRLLHAFSWRLILLYLKFPYFITNIFIRLIPRYRKEYQVIKNADYVISAPGGINLGLYRDVEYIWRLFQALSLRKIYAIYSPSIGPFPKSTNWLSRRAKEILEGAHFLSLRDARSFDFADDFNLSYVKSIDTAFLESSKIKIPEDVKAKLLEKYVVLVPNQLYKWHGNYRNESPNKIDEFYKKLIKAFSDEGCQVVLLPQLYCQGDYNDESYFETLIGNNKNLIIISSEYSSDVQQSIIKKASFVVGARYHTIVFSINNATPFYCLSYEHKMTNMLDLLNLRDYCIDIAAAFNNHEAVLAKILNAYNNAKDMKGLLNEAKKKANKTANDTFELFIKRLNC